MDWLLATAIEKGVQTEDAGETPPGTLADSGRPVSVADWG